MKTNALQQAGKIFEVCLSCRVFLVVEQSPLLMDVATRALEEKRLSLRQTAPSLAATGLPVHETSTSSDTQKLRDSEQLKTTFALYFPDAKQQNDVTTCTKLKTCGHRIKSSDGRWKFRRPKQDSEWSSR